MQLGAGMGSVAANVAAIVEKARTSWLKNNEVLDLLEGYVAAGLSVCQEPPVRPEGGCCAVARWDSLRVHAYQLMRADAMHAAARAR